MLHLRSKLPLLLTGFLFFASLAHADTLSCFNGTTFVTCGTVTVTANGANQVTVTITMDSGFAIKLENGQDVAFNSTATPLTLSNLQVLTAGGTNEAVDSIFNTTSVAAGGSGSASATQQQVDGQGKFNYTINSIGTGTLGGGFTSTTSLSFTLDGTNVASLFSANGAGNIFSVHYCTNLTSGGPGTGFNCGNLTGFSGAQPSPPVPEPASLTLLGSGLLAMAGVMRRRLR